MIDFQFIDTLQLDLSYVEDWYKKVAQSEGKTLGNFSIIIGTDDWILEMNKQYLNHDFYTDIITFDYCEGNIVSGDLLLSFDRIKENAQTFNVSETEELNRVLVHGLLHLCGYGDETEDEIMIMREKEGYYLNLLNKTD